MRIVHCGGQGTAEWFAARIGMLTSSRIADAIGKRKRDPDTPLQARVDLCLELAVERVTQKPSQHFVSDWMTRGAELEPLARAAYELRTDQEVTAIDFVLHPEIEWSGCSPDGACGDELIEIKVPKPETHASYLLADCVPKQYLDQMCWQLACCPECKANTFISWCPDFPEGLDLFICRLPRDPERIAAMEAEAVKFLQEVGNTVLRLRGGLEGFMEASVANHKSGAFVDSGRQESQGEVVQPLVPRAQIPEMGDV